MVDIKWSIPLTLMVTVNDTTNQGGKMERKYEIKECLITVKQVFFSLSMEGSLVDI